MKPSKANTENPSKSEKSSLGKLLKEGKQKCNDKPGEEFITPDPSRSAPDKDIETVEIDKMGISKKTKNQPSDQGDTSKNKK